MTNPYYNPTGNPATGSQGLSALMRTEFANVAAAFNLMPTLAGNGGLVVAVNLGGTALTVVPGSTITTTGAFTTIFAQAANVTLTLPGVNGTLALLASPAFTGTPTAPTASGGTNTAQLATTAFVTAAVGAAGVVSSVAGRTGAVVLAVADVSGAAALASPALTGTPTAPTGAPGTNTTQLATTAFVTAAVGSGGVVSSVAGRTGAVVLAVADVSGAAPLASPALTGNPTAPTATAGDNDTSIATTAFVQTMPAAPPAIGNTTPNTGAFTTLSATSTVSGAGFTARFASPGPIGNTATSTGAFTTVAASGQVTSTITTGTAPLVIASTTNVANLNASSLSGATFASPGAIGGTTAGSGTFTTLTANSTATFNGAITFNGTPSTGAGVGMNVHGLLFNDTGTSSVQAAGFQYATSGPLAYGGGTLGYGIQTTQNIVCPNVFVVSDARLKFNIVEINHRDAIEWVKASRPVEYMKRPSFDAPDEAAGNEAGFIAQEQVRVGMGRFIMPIFSPGMPALDELDMKMAADHAITLSDSYKVAYLTAALQAAILRIEDLEKVLS